MTYTPKRPLWSHQKAAIKKMKGKEAFALLMAMRTGKTCTLLTDFGLLVDGGKCDDLLVLAPAGVYRTWEGAVAEHLNLPRVRTFTWQSGQGTRAKQELKEFLADHSVPRILLVNIEAISSVEKARELCAGFLRQRKAMLAVDESTILKNPSAQRTKFVNFHLKPLARYRRILSGLPSPNSPLDIFSQFEFLDSSILGFKSFYAFRARYAVMRKMSFGGRQVPIVVSYRGLDELKKKIEPFSFRVQLEDCYDLPKKMYIMREVSLTDEQKRVYDDIKRYATAQLSAEKHVTAAQVVTQILRMHQVLCGHAVAEDGTIISLPENRTAELLGLLEEHNGKSIIWCSYDQDIQKVSAAIQKRFGAPVARFWGGNRATREEEEKIFLNTPSCRHMVATAAAGGRGRTWTVADLEIYHSNTANLEHRSQSEERAQGVDKSRSVAYVDLVVKGTVDEKIIKLLRDKINMAAAVTGDKWKEWLI